MEHSEVVRARRMVRAFEARPVDEHALDRVLDAARRVPSAGHTQAVDLVVLEGDQTTRLWDVSLPPERRDGFAFGGMLDAPVAVVPVVRPSAYPERYAEADKVATGLGDGDRWTVPYWWVDGGMATLALLHAAVDEGLAACLFSLFERERPVLDALGVPDDRRALGVVLVGHPTPDRPGRSASRPRRSFDDVVHRGGW